MVADKSPQWRVIHVYIDAIVALVQLKEIRSHNFGIPQYLCTYVISMTGGNRMFVAVCVSGLCIQEEQTRYKGRGQYKKRALIQKSIARVQSLWEFLTLFFPPHLQVYHFSFPFLTCVKYCYSHTGFMWGIPLNCCCLQSSCAYA